MSQDTTVNTLVINTLTKQQYQSIQNPSSTELYLVTDDSGGGSSQLATDIATIPTSSAVLTTKNITVNGTYNASSDSADGYSSVTVAVPGGAKYGVMIDDLLSNINSSTGKWSNWIYTPKSIDLSALKSMDNDSEPDHLKYKFYKIRARSIDLSNLETISVTYGYSCESAFENTNGVTSLDLSSLMTISCGSTGGVCKNMFSSCSVNGVASSRLALSIPELTTISGKEACYGMFSGNSNISSISLPKLRTISGESACNSMFFGNRNATTVDLSALEGISGQRACAYMFDSCASLTSVSFDSLKTITGFCACDRMFESCTSLTSISFLALVSNFSSGDSNVFDDYMLQGVSGCTVHFPSNLQSEIGSWHSVTTGFSGTNTTVLFDLPSTAS